MKKLFFALLAVAAVLTANAQYAFDALKLSETELRGTSRYQSMAGAFGALGGDISSVVHNNPGGIGVYRNNDLSITAALDFNKSKSPSLESDRETKFNLNTFGYVGVIRINSETMPNFNWSVSFNRLNSFHRRYAGYGDGIPTSITNYIADWAVEDGVTAEQLARKPYNENNGPRWNQILAYNNNLMLDAEYGLQGLGVEGTHGYNEFVVEESGHADEYNISFGGNVRNKVFWGVGFGVNDFKYEYTKYYGESLTNTVIYDRPDRKTANLVDGDADFGFTDASRTTGTGFNFKLGAIFKPVNEFRLGLAFHTPTFYRMRESYITTVSAAFAAGDNVSYKLNDETPASVVRYRLNTPWKLIASAAVVVGRSGIISADYEYRGNTGMRILDDRGHAYPDATADIKDYFTGSHIFRVGGEVRVSPAFSLRAGYSYQTTPVKDAIKDNLVNVNVSGSCPQYTFDKNIQHITAGFGYRYQNFYLDLAYVYKKRASEYHAFPPEIYDDPAYDQPSLYCDVNDNNHRLSLTLGFRF